MGVCERHAQGDLRRLRSACRIYFSSSWVGICQMEPKKTLASPTLSRILDTNAEQSAIRNACQESMGSQEKFSGRTLLHANALLSISEAELSMDTTKTMQSGCQSQGKCSTRPCYPK